MKNYKKYSDFIIPVSVLILVILSLYLYFCGESFQLKKLSRVDPLVIDQLKSAHIPNFTSGKNETITLINGEYKEVIKDRNLSFNTWIKLNTEPTSYAIADVTGDGVPDIIATLVWSGGGTGKFGEIAVFKNNNGSPEYVTSQEIGDRIKINKISVEGEAIVADIITQGPGEAYCCGTMRQVLTFKVDNNTLIEQKLTKEISKPVPAPYVITVLSPNGGERVEKGKVYPITWKSTNDLSGINVGITLYNTEGYGLLTIIQTMKNTGLYNWLVPENIPNGSYKIDISQVRSTDGGVAHDSSNNYFTIVHPTSP